MKIITSQHLKHIIIFSFGALALVAGFVQTVRDDARVSLVEASALTHNVSGFAWTSNIGWISFNCEDSTGSGMNTCGVADYGVSVDPVSGNFSGYAWSSSIGWITFNQAELVGCPSGPCIANTSPSSPSDVYVTGWARACSVFGSGCSAPLKGVTVLGGWDGWIKLSDNAWAPDTDYGKRGVWLEKDGGLKNNYLQGYAWGSDVLGWIRFDALVGATGASSVDLITQSPNNVTNANKSVTFTGTLRNSGIGATLGGEQIYGDVEVDWNQADCTSATVDASFPAGGPWTSLGAGASQALSGNVVYTNLQGGNHCYRLIADRTNLVSETNDTNNATAPWTAFTVVPVTSSFTAVPTTINVNTTSNLTWSTSGATSCTVHGSQVSSSTFSDIKSGTSGTNVATLPLTADTRYDLECDSMGIVLKSVNINVNTVALDANPLIVEEGQNTTLTWDLFGQTNCNLTGGGLSQVLGANGNQTITVNGNATYTLTCPIGSDSVKVEVPQRGFET